MDKTTRDLLIAVRDMAPHGPAVIEWMHAGCPDIPAEAGGEGPAPFPGMWVEIDGDAMAVDAYRHSDGGWYVHTHDGWAYVDEVTAIFNRDGREAWRRA